MTEPTIITPIAAQQPSPDADMFQPSPDRKYVLSVAIPVYNEERTLLEILARVRAAPLPGGAKEILVDDDGSTIPAFARLA